MMVEFYLAQQKQLKNTLDCVCVFYPTPILKR